LSIIPRVRGVETKAIVLQWPEVDSLIEQLKNIEQVKDVYKGRFFRSPGLAPTFQVR
jgi:hypothetical protein